jgi:diguanylate cyclase (GGDEF)-like protein/putative nucleotidyltransferase with HDIG domain
MTSLERINERFVLRAGIAALFAALGLLAGLSLVTQRHITALAAQAEASGARAALFQEVEGRVEQEQSLERAYRLERSAAVRAEHARAGRRVAAAARRVAVLDPSPATARQTARVLGLQRRYAAAAERVFDAADDGDVGRERRIQQGEVDPVFGALEALVGREARRSTSASLRFSADLRRTQAAALTVTTFAFAAVLLLLVWATRLLLRFRRRLRESRRAEVDRLAQMAMTDPLTGLRNHRAFQEDLARDLQRTARTGEPLALALMDLDDLRTVNDDHGHQAGDERLQALAAAIRAAQRATDGAYRTGGDEFAVILPGARALGAMQFAQRVRALTCEGAHGPAFTVTAGISEAVGLRGRDELVREADLALIGAKRVHRDVAVYGPDLELPADGGAGSEDDRHARTLASALARAVDAKDSYTRSHCQTVSQLAATIAAELGFTGERLGRIRLAGLLHDVGKIGVPDAILNKPGRLTDEEYDVMKGHSVLGFDIVQAADMPVEARWVRHHHERFDGRGYPDGLAGGDIPLESRIILVADAFEAMTSDRPYRTAPGPEAAVAELRTHAGTQFDPTVVAALCRVLGRGGIGEPSPDGAAAA